MTYTSSQQLNCLDQTLNCQRPQIMGILNVTPDSFFDGDQHFKFSDAMQRVETMLEEGADIIDVGGESTRPNASPISLEEELSRVLPLVEAISKRFNTVISIDTYKPEVMQAAVELGAGFINDIYALRQAGALDMAAQLQVPVCLMHMLGEPKSMQESPHYQNVIEDVFQFLACRLQACLESGIPLKHIVIDPGFGFGKTWQHNLLLLRHLERFQHLNRPIAVSLSRKNMDGLTMNLPAAERLFPTVSLAVMALTNGARLIRTHDVKATRLAIDMAYKIIAEQVEQPELYPQQEETHHLT